MQIQEKGANFTEKGLKCMQKDKKKQNPVRCAKFTEKSTLYQDCSNRWLELLANVIVGVLTLVQQLHSRFNSRFTVAGPTSILKLRTNCGF